MEKRIIVDSLFNEETRVAFINGSEIEHFEVDTSSNKKQLKGNVYLAKVSRVEPSLQAAFIDYGGNRQGFLPFSEISNDYFKIPNADKKNKKNNDDFVVKDFYSDSEEKDKKKKFPRIPNFKKYKIQEVIKKNQIMLVQVVKDERGNKGAALTTFISIAGKYCVLMPNKSLGIKISKKISDFKERKKLTKISNKCKLTKEMGLIIRTASRDCDEDNLKKDFDYVLGIWKSIKEKTINSLAPKLINEDSNIINKFIRDSFIEEYKEIIVEGQAYERAKKYMKTLLPGQERKVKEYKNTKLPIMEYYELEKKIDSIYETKVRLKSGGYIIINSTEALTAIDINSGQSTKERNVEETALKTNIEAVDEICKQIRIRNLAGLIVIDFIDMEFIRNKIIIERRLKETLRYDRAKCQISRISRFGLLELSRQRIGPSLEETTMEDGIISGIRCTTRSITSSVAKILRKLKYLKLTKKIKELNLHVYETIYNYISENNKNLLKDIGKQLKTKIVLVKDQSIAPPFFILNAIDKNKKNNIETIYDDVPKFLNEDEIKENEELKEKRRKNIKKKEKTKLTKPLKEIEEKNNEVNSLAK